MKKILVILTIAVALAVLSSGCVAPTDQPTGTGVATTPTDIGGSGSGVVPTGTNDNTPTSQPTATATQSSGSGSSTWTGGGSSGGGSSGGNSGGIGDNSGAGPDDIFPDLPPTKVDDPDEPTLYAPLDPTPSEDVWLELDYFD